MTGPPYLSPEYFNQFVTCYLIRICKAIKEAGGIPRIHSHGKIRKVLESKVNLETGEETELLQLTEDITGISAYNTFENINIIGNHIYFVAFTEGETRESVRRALFTMTTDGENITKTYRGEH